MLSLWMLDQVNYFGPIKYSLLKLITIKPKNKLNLAERLYITKIHVVGPMGLVHGPIKVKSIKLTKELYK